MKTSYVKTTWVDNKTSVNAANMNKIESAIADLYAHALTPAEIVGGNNVNVHVVANGLVEVSLCERVMESDSLGGIEWTDEELDSYISGVLYFVLDPETKLLRKIIINGVEIWNVVE